MEKKKDFFDTIYNFKKIPCSLREVEFFLTKVNKAYIGTKILTLFDRLLK